MNRSLVEQGWNTYGGYDYYQGEGGCILDSYHYPPCNRARVVSFDRPFDTLGSSDFLTNEYPLVQFAEQEGLDVTYCTDICVSEHPTFLLRHRALIALDHDETWTNSERVGVLNAAAAGVNMAFLGAATFVRHARLEASPLGPDRQEVDYRNAEEDPLNGHGDPLEVTGNTWEAGPAPWDASAFLGQIYSGFLEPDEPERADRGDRRRGVDLEGHGPAQRRDDPGGHQLRHRPHRPVGPDPGEPAGAGALAHRAVAVVHEPGRVERLHVLRHDLLHRAGQQGRCLRQRRQCWVAALSPCPTSPANCPSELARKVTANLLWLFGQGPAGKLQPSVANWRSVAPARLLTVTPTPADAHPPRRRRPHAERRPMPTPPVADSSGLAARWSSSRATSSDEAVSGIQWLAPRAPRTGTAPPRSPSSPRAAPAPRAMSSVDQTYMVGDVIGPRPAMDSTDIARYQLRGGERPGLTHGLDELAGVVDIHPARREHRPQPVAAVVAPSSRFSATPPSA